MSCGPQAAQDCPSWDRNLIPGPIPVLECVSQNIPARWLSDTVQTASKAAGVGLPGSTAISGVIYASGSIPGAVLFVPR